MQGNVGFGCGQCFPCRLNRRRLWTHRLVLESFCHDSSVFLTLTYNEDNLPWPGTLNPKHLSGYIKRLRARIHPKKLRFYGVGEYGSQTWRPHYHAAVFGVGYEEFSDLESAWSNEDGPIGWVHIGDLNPESAQYLCGYTVKKMTSSHDERIRDFAHEGVYLHPEFSRQSNRPGIGAKAVPVIADSILTDFGLDEYLATGDVPQSLRHGTKNLPLGRYLREKLREEIGVSDIEKEQIKARFFAEKSAEMRALLESTPLNSKKGEYSLKDRLVNNRRQRAASLEALDKIKSQERQKL